MFQQDNKIENYQSNLVKLAFKVLHKYQTRIEMINTLYKMGMTRHECMILELVLLGKNLQSIKTILLFSEQIYIPILTQLTETLKNHDRNFKLFKKLKGGK